MSSRVCCDLVWHCVSYDDAAPSGTSTVYLFSVSLYYMVRIRSRIIKDTLSREMQFSFLSIIRPVKRNFAWKRERERKRKKNRKNVAADISSKRTSQLLYFVEYVISHF